MSLLPKICQYCVYQPIPILKSEKSAGDFGPDPFRYAHSLLTRKSDKILKRENRNVTWTMAGTADCCCRVGAVWAGQDQLADG
jgi:hypothetical protein